MDGICKALHAASPNFSCDARTISCDFFLRASLYAQLSRNSVKLTARAGRYFQDSASERRLTVVHGVRGAWLGVARVGAG
jgi:hypothetical protein